MKLHIVIDLSSIAPVVRPHVARARRAWARLVRLHVSQLDPLAPTRLHRRYALLLARLERQS